MEEKSERVSLNIQLGNILFMKGPYSLMIFQIQGQGRFGLRLRFNANTTYRRLQLESWLRDFLEKYMPL